MTGKPSHWADLLLTIWVLTVAVFYIRGCFSPGLIGVYTPSGAAIYALVLLVAVGTLAWRYLHQAKD
jgi:hypothetical protein